MYPRDYRMTIFCFLWKGRRTISVSILSVWETCYPHFKFMVRPKVDCMRSRRNATPVWPLRVSTLLTCVDVLYASLVGPQRTLPARGTRAVTTTAISINDHPTPYRSGADGAQKRGLQAWSTNQGEEYIPPMSSTVSSGVSDHDVQVER